MDYACIDLLPQSPEAMMRDTRMQQRIVNTLSFLIEQLVEALRYFYILREFNAFDPHVGETACQIRAYKLLQLILENRSKPLSNPVNRINQLLSIQEKLHRVRKSNQIGTRIPNNQLTISQYVERIGCYFSLTKTERFLIKAYFLTVFKTVVSGNETYINYQAISEKAQVSRKFAKKLTRYYQISLAKMSCDYILGWVKHTDGLDQWGVLTKLRRLDDDEREVLPCYFFTKALYKQLLSNHVPILVMVSRSGPQSQENSLFLFSHEAMDGAVVSRGTISSAMLEKPCFVISGESRAPGDEIEGEEALLSRFNYYGLGQILLANMAVHPQYSGNRLRHYRENPFVGLEEENGTVDFMSKELQAMSEVAIKMGCCQKTPSLFSVNHIYCDTIENLLQRKMLRDEKINTDNFVLDMGALLESG